MPPPTFSSAQRDLLAALLAWRRDVRRFRPDPLPEGTLDRLLALACQAPSVGLSEPWRFVIVEDAARRAAIRANFEVANAEALTGQHGERRGLYARLKLGGLDDAPVQIATFADPGGTQGHGLGRHTMPATLDYSVAIAIHTLWLVARAEGIGVGWVSILDPDAIAPIVDVPRHWRFVGYLCVGYPVAESDRPELEEAGWETRRDPADRVIRR